MQAAVARRRDEPETVTGTPRSSAKRRPGDGRSRRPTRPEPTPPPTWPRAATCPGGGTTLPPHRRAGRPLTVVAWRGVLQGRQPSDQGKENRQPDRGARAREDRFSS